MPKHLGLRKAIPRMANQKEKNIEHEIETGVVGLGIPS